MCLVAEWTVQKYNINIIVQKFYCFKVPKTWMECHNFCQVIYLENDYNSLVQKTKIALNKCHQLCHPGPVTSYSCHWEWEPWRFTGFLLQPPSRQVGCGGGVGRIGKKPVRGTSGFPMSGSNQSSFILGFSKMFCWKKGFLALKRCENYHLDEFNVLLFFFFKTHTWKLYMNMP